jgi:hypothetical protein
MYEQAQLMYWLASGTNQMELWVYPALTNSNLKSRVASKVWRCKLFAMRVGTVRAIQWQCMIALLTWDYFSSCNQLDKRWPSFTSSARPWITRKYAILTYDHELRFVIYTAFSSEVTVKLVRKRDQTACVVVCLRPRQSIVYGTGTP